MPDEAQVTVVIFERSYPWPDDYKPLDAVLIHELTGMEFDEYLDALGDDTRFLRAVPGLLGLVLSRAYPRWSRAQLIENIQRVTGSDWRIDGIDDDIAAGEGDAGPPLEPAGEARPEGSSDSTLPLSSSEPAEA